jgi:site-specific DNA recombinase
LLADARAGKFNALVVYKGDRIGRDVLVNEIAVREIYDNLGIAVMGIAEQIDLSSPIGRAMFTFQSAIGRLERENTLRRSKDATLRLAKDGVWLGASCLSATVWRARGARCAFAWPRRKSRDWASARWTW